VKIFIVEYRCIMNICMEKGQCIVNISMSILVYREHIDVEYQCIVNISMWNTSVS